MRKKDFWLILIAVAAAMVLAIGQFASEAVTTGSWGLSFQNAGKAPAGPASRELLKKYDAAYVGSDKDPVLYLITSWAAPVPRMARCIWCLPKLPLLLR